MLTIIIIVIVIIHFRAWEVLLFWFEIPVSFLEGQCLYMTYEPKLNLLDLHCHTLSETH
jgi:hypothetical protein